MHAMWCEEGAVRLQAVLDKDYSLQAVCWVQTLLLHWEHAERTKGVEYEADGDSFCL